MSSDASDSDGGEPLYGTNHISGYQNPPPPTDGQPYLEIVEQPQSRGFRFRYACEGKSHGGLQGVNSRREKKSYPTVRVVNYKGPAKIIVSLVTDEPEPRPHAHELIGKNCQKGACSVTIKGDNNMAVSFPNLGVRHVTKKTVPKILTERILETMKVDKMMTGVLGQDAEHIILTAEEQRIAEQQATEQAKNMPLSVVRLQFRAYLQDQNAVFSRVLPGIVSVPIFDSKAPCAALLKICRMDKVGGCCTGNEEVFLLCDKVQKDDIAVRFYEQDDEGNVKWEDYGNFAPHDVHRQYAIVFRTPGYLDTNIDRPVNVLVQLKRFSDGEVSDPKTFTFYPQQRDLEDIQKKRRKNIPNFSDDLFSTGPGMSSLSSIPSGFGPGAFGSNTTLGEYTNRFDSNGNGHTRAMAAPGVRQSTSGPFSWSNPTTTTQPQQVRPGVVTFGHVLNGRGVPPPTVSAAPESDLQADGCPSDVEFLSCRGMANAEPAVGFFTKQLPEIVPGKPVVSVTDERAARTVVSAVEERTLHSLPEKTSSASVLKGPDVGVGGGMQRNVSGGSFACPPMMPVAIVMKIAERTTTALQNYARTGDCRHLILAARHLVVETDENGDNSLHLAVIHGQPLAANNLLFALATLPENAAINQYNDLKQTPLYLSMITQQLDVLSALVQSGADVTKIDGRGDTLLHIAARSGYEQCLHRLLLADSTDNGHVTRRADIDALNFDGFSALHLAVFGGHLNCVKLLVTPGGADVNLADGRSGRTALHHAVDTDNLAIVGHLILECGADIDNPAYDGNTALHLAVAANRLGVAALLMAAGANPDIENYDIRHEYDDVSDESDDVVGSKPESGDSDGKMVCKTSQGKMEHRDSDKDLDTTAGDTEENTAEQPYGFTAKDLATGNKMQRLLNGEAYSSVVEPMQSSQLAATRLDIEGRTKSIHDSGIESVRLMSTGSSAVQMPGDLSKLDSLTRTRLSKLLDPERTGSDWHELAHRLGFSMLATALQLQKSPTRSLLDNFEVLEGSVSGLRKCLLEMERMDAVNVIDEAICPRASNEM